MVTLKGKKTDKKKIIKKEDTLYKLFEKAWKNNKLDKKEMENISVEDAKQLKSLAKVLKNPRFVKFFKMMGEIQLTTSKRGWLPEIFLSEYRSKHGKYPDEMYMCHGNIKRKTS